MLKKFLLSYIFLCVVPFLVLGVLLASISQKNIKAELMNAVEISMDESQRSLNNVVSEAREICFTIMNDDSFQALLQQTVGAQGDTDELVRELGDSMSAYPMYGSKGTKLCLYLARSGDEAPVYDTEFVKTASAQTGDWYERALKEPGKFIWFVETGENGSFLCAAKGVFSTADWETVLGVLTIRLDLTFMRSITMAANTTGNRLYLVDENGQIAYPYYNYDHLPQEILQSGESGEYEVGDKYFVVKPIITTGWTLIKSVPLTDINGRTRLIVRTIMVVAIVFAAVSSMAIVYYDRQISKPIQHLATQMQQIQAGDLKPIEGGPKKGEIADLYHSFNYMTERLKKQIQETYVAQIRAKEAELRTLQAQINPHFLYNTLDSINWLAIRYKAYDISQMVLSLSDMLRLSLNNGKNMLTIAEELKQVDSYITLQKVRYSDRFSVEYAVEEEVKSRPVLKMVLQPLVENAIVHGFEKIQSGGLIRITIHAEGEGYTYFEVANNGALIDLKAMEERMQSAREQENSRHGFGIRNVNERIKACYGQSYGLSFTIRDGFTVACFTLPVEGDFHDDDSADRG